MRAARALWHSFGSAPARPEHRPIVAMKADHVPVDVRQCFCAAKKIKRVVVRAVFVLVPTNVELVRPTAAEEQVAVVGKFQGFLEVLGCVGLVVANVAHPPHRLPLLENGRGAGGVIGLLIDAVGVDEVELPILTFVRDALVFHMRDGELLDIGRITVAHSIEEELLQPLVAHVALLCEERIELRKQTTTNL